MAERSLLICSARGCLERADGAVTMAYARRVLLCDEHLKPIRQALVKLLA